MATTPIVHIYNEINIGRYTTVKHFELAETLNGLPQLSTLINVSINRNYALSMPRYWVKERGNGGWIKPHLTGLFETGISHLYRGDANHKSHLLLFQFADNELTLFFFKNQFSRDLSRFLGRINQSYHEQKKRV